MRTEVYAWIGPAFGRMRLLCLLRLLFRKEILCRVGVRWLAGVLIVNLEERFYVWISTLAGRRPGSVPSRCRAGSRRRFADCFCAGSTPQAGHQRVAVVCPVVARLLGRAH